MTQTTLYVGNLAWETGVEELEQVFSEFGEVKSVRIIKDTATGRSRGFGFVEMPHDAAITAQASLHGARLRGRELAVAPAKPAGAVLAGTRQL
jgi:RNA recognition motif-containing protein